MESGDVLAPTRAYVPLRPCLAHARVSTTARKGIREECGSVLNTTPASAAEHHSRTALGRGSTAVPEEFNQRPNLIWVPTHERKVYYGTHRYSSGKTCSRIIPTIPSSRPRTSDRAPRRALWPIANASHRSQRLNKSVYGPLPPTKSWIKVFVATFGIQLLGN